MGIVKRTIELNAELDAALQKAAGDAKSSPSALIEAAVDRYLRDLEDLAEDVRRWSAYEETGRAIDAQDIEAWVESWGSPNERPRPA
jgi:predicted transcriptional regulator